MARINFTNNINVSVQVGDTLYHHVGSGSPAAELGTITAVGPNFVEIDNTNIGTAAATDFFSFKKSSGSNHYANSGVKGYHAKVRISNGPDENGNVVSTKQELFHLGSEITESSK